MSSAVRDRHTVHELMLDQADRADLFERRYVGVCSLLRMVIDQFDAVDAAEVLDKGWRP